MPVVTGELLASGGALGHDDGLSLRAGLSTAGEQLVLDPLDLRLAGSDVRATAVLHRDTGIVEGNVQLRIADVAALDTVLPDGWRPGARSRS